MSELNLRAHDITMLYLSKYVDIDSDTGNAEILSELNAEYERAYTYLCEELKNE